MKLKIGDKVKVFEDPLTCYNLEFVGEVRAIKDDDCIGETLHCSVWDFKEKALFYRKININNH